MPNRIFELRSPMPVSAEELYAWHARPLAFQRLQPPWEHATVVSQEGTFGTDGYRVTVRTGLVGPVNGTWVAELYDFRPGQQFQDRELRGPFAFWNHTHRFVPDTPTVSYTHLDVYKRQHKDWSQYDTAHVVFRPKHMTPEQLADGYGYCYRRLFSHHSIWKRRPADWHAVPAYLGMAYLYKRSNWLWPLLIRHRLTHWTWRPLLELSRARHLRFRKRLAASAVGGGTENGCVRVPVYAGV